MYKMIALDLDGTTLNSYGQMTRNTIDTVKKAAEQGTEVVIASGRNMNAIKALADEIGNINYVIAGNGAVIYDLKQNQILYENYIPKMKAFEIIDICEKNDIYYSVYTNRTIITDTLKHNVLYYYKENMKKEDTKKTHITLTYDIPEYVKNMKEEVLKIFVCDEQKSVFNSIIKKFDQVKNIDILDVSHMTRKMIRQGTYEIPIEYYYTEISTKNVDKWNSIKFIMDKKGINEEEVITIGDNENDKKMIKEAGMGIAMKNGTPSVTSIAKFVTDSNDEEGVAKAIKKFLIK